MLFTENQITTVQKDKLKLLEVTLSKWGQNILFVSQGDIKFLWNRHILDSLQVSCFIKEKQTCLDMGGGIGFPTLPLAIVNEETHFVLVDIHTKKTNLAKQLVGILKLKNVTVKCGKIEECEKLYYDVVFSRALGYLSEDAKKACPLLKNEGQFITFKRKKEIIKVNGYQNTENKLYSLPDCEGVFHLVTMTKYE